MKKTALYILILLGICSCSTTRLIEDGEQLYTGTKKIDFEGSKEFASTLIGETAITEVEAALAAPPNASQFKISRYPIWSMVVQCIRRQR